MSDEIRNTNQLFKKSEDWESCYKFVSLEICIKDVIVDIEDTSSGVYSEMYDKKEFIKALRDFADFLEK